MFKSLSLWANSATWFAQILFLIGISFQIKLNYKLKSSKGLSDLLLVGFFNGYTTFTFYVFCLNLPIAYKILVPIELVASIILLMQRFYYIRVKQKKDFYLFYFLMSNIFLALIFIPISQRYSIKMGYFFGWVMTFIWMIYQIPQVFKVYKAKSTRGFSLGLVTMIGVGNLAEFLAAIYLKLPVPTIVNGIRGVFTWLFLYLQFWLYRKK